MIWHRRLRHSSLKTIKSLVHSSLVSLSTILPLNLLCDSYLFNKRQRLLFGESTLESNEPLDLVYTDVWGLSPIQSIDRFYYYVIFVDHFTKYVWLYPLCLKSNVFTIFCQYKAVVEKFLNVPLSLFTWMVVENILL